MNVAYIRVSSRDQNLDRQIEDLKKFNIEKWFSEKKSGKNTERPELQNMLEFIREGDTVYIESFSRLARSTRDLLNLIETLKEKRVGLVSAKENIDTNTPQGQLMLSVLGAINQFERDCILERQKEGIELAKKRGYYHKTDRRKKVDDEEYNRLYEKYMHREITKAEMARQLKISRPTLNNIIKEKTQCKES